MSSIKWTAMMPIAILWAAPAAAIPPDFKAKADALLAESYAENVPGAAVIVVDHGRIVYAGARGLADASANRPIAADTVFRLASITKQFTAAVILQLAEEGKLRLSDPVSRFLPDYPKPGANATIAQLLNHTSGIANFTPMLQQGDKHTQAYTTEGLIAEFRDQPQQFPVGTRYAYGGSGYTLAGAIIEKVTGNPWYQAIEDRISKPLGLTTIRYSATPESVPAMAVPYTLEGGKIVPARPYHMSWGHAGGGLVGSIVDLANWSKALHGGKVVKSESYREMIAPTRLIGGEEVPYGLGLDNREVQGRRALIHGGSGPGISNGGVYVPQEDLFVAILANSDALRPSTYTVAFRLTALAMGVPFPALTRADVPMAQIKPVLGIYKSSAGERRLSAREGKLFLRGSVGGDMEVEPAGGGRFFYPGSLTWFDIARDATGKHVMTIHANGADKGESAVWSGPLPGEDGR